MKGANEYCRVFKETQQIDRLYFVVSSHARGPTFRIFVLPKGVTVLNKDAVEVYGIISGQPGWTEEYGWLHKGKWQLDFQAIYNKLKEARDADAIRIVKQNKERKSREEKSLLDRLKSYDQ